MNTGHRMERWLLCRATITNQALIDRERTFILLSASHSTRVSTPITQQYILHVDVCAQQSNSDNYGIGLLHTGRWATSYPMRVLLYTCGKTINIVYLDWLFKEIMLT